MDIRFLRSHRLCSTNNLRYALVKITGASLTTSNSPTPVAVGKGLVAYAKDDGSNEVTLTYSEALPYAAVPIFQPTLSTTAVLPSSISSTTSGLVYKTVDGADYTTAKTLQNMTIILLVPEGILT